MSKLFEFFIKLFKFIPILWNYRCWDYTFMLANMKASTELMLKSYVVNESNSEDIKELKRFIQLLDNNLNDKYFLNARSTNDLKKAVVLEEKEWDELCDIFKGNKETSKHGVRGWWV